MNLKNFYSEYNNNGALSYSLGSNKESIGPSVDLHKGASYPGDKRIFSLNKKKFFKKCFNMSLGSLLLHNGYTYHYSGANKSRKSRLTLSIRFIAGDHKYIPHPFEGGAFSKQIQLEKGQIFSGKPFPIIY
jgi:ectoine hydroxylase-related dioxygenase (phytanoyl-CoA dioxygenase family)